MNLKYTCIVCPLGCSLELNIGENEIQSIVGAKCSKGIDYATNEYHHPMRTVTSTIPVQNGDRMRVSVRTAGEIPKEKIFDVMHVIHQMELTAPIEMGEVLCHNIAMTHVNLISTCEVQLAKKW